MARTPRTPSVTFGDSSLQGGRQEQWRGRRELPCLPPRGRCPERGGGSHSLSRLWRQLPPRRAPRAMARAPRTPLPPSERAVPRKGRWESLPQSPLVTAPSKEGAKDCGGGAELPCLPPRGRCPERGGGSTCLPLRGRWLRGDAAQTVGVGSVFLVFLLSVWQNRGMI